MRVVIGIHDESKSYGQIGSKFCVGRDSIEGLCLQQGTNADRAAKAGSLQKSSPALSPHSGRTLGKPVTMQLSTKNREYTNNPVVSVNAC